MCERVLSVDFPLLGGQKSRSEPSVLGGPNMAMMWPHSLLAVRAERGERAGKLGSSVAALSHAVGEVRGLVSHHGQNLRF